MNNAKRSRPPGMRVPRRLRRIARLAPSLKSNDLAHFTDFYPRRALATSVRRTAWTHLYRCRVGVADDDEYDDEPFYRIRRRELFGWGGFSIGISPPRQSTVVVINSSSVQRKKGRCARKRPPARVEIKKTIILLTFSAFMHNRVMTFSIDSMLLYWERKKIWKTLFEQFRLDCWILWKVFLYIFFHFIKKGMRPSFTKAIQCYS